MEKYKNLPTVIQAARWMGMTNKDAEKFSEDHKIPVFKVGARNGKFGLIVQTLEGDAVAQRGTWILKGTKGEFWPVRADIFKQKYEKVEDDS